MLLILIFYNFWLSLLISIRRIIKHNITNTRYYILEKKKINPLNTYNIIIYYHDRRAQEFFTK